MIFQPQELTVLCSEMTERLIKAAGFLKMPHEMAESLSKSLPGYKNITIRDEKNKFSALLTASTDYGDAEAYSMKISLHPEKGALKLDNFYIVDPAQRGQGVGKKGLRNIYNLACEEEKIRNIELTATLDNGAYVWAKMGFKPNQGDFVRFQKAARQRLQELQENLPEHAKIDPDVYEIADRLLDHEKTKDPRAIWVLSDMGVQVDYSYNDGRLVPVPKKLSFILMEWMEYRASLDLENKEQTSRLQDALGIERVSKETIQPNRVIEGSVITSKIKKELPYGSPRQEIL